MWGRGVSDCSVLIYFSLVFCTFFWLVKGGWVGNGFECCVWLRREGGFCCAAGQGLGEDFPTIATSTVSPNDLSSL